MVDSPVDTLEQTILPDITELLKLSIFNPSSRINVPLSDKTVDIIQSLIRTQPDLFKEINIDMINIIQDNKIDTKDVPHFIQLVNKLYIILNTYNITKNQLSKHDLADTCATIVKFLIQFLIEEEYIPMKEAIRDAFYTDTNALIDACVSLIKLNKTIQIKAWFPKLVAFFKRLLF